MGARDGLGKKSERKFWNKEVDAASEERNMEIKVPDRIAVPDQAMDGVIGDEGDEREVSSGSATWTPKGSTASSLQRRGNGCA